MMKHFLLSFSFTLFSCVAIAQTDSTAIRDIEKTCRHYLDGGVNGDSVMYSKAFSPDGQMMYMQNETLMNISLKDFMAGMGEAGKMMIKTRIANIQVFGNAACAILTLEFPTVRFHDIMGLLKTKDGWKIVSKICYGEQLSTK